jgi:hypothetical protein
VAATMVTTPAATMISPPMTPFIFADGVMAGGH